MGDKAPFIHLHTHTDYSLLDGACEISQMMQVVAEQKSPAIAMTDHGNLFGGLEFYNAAKGQGINGILGCEMYVTREAASVKNAGNRYHHLVLLCENEEGYRNLISLVSTGYIDGFYQKPRIDKGLLAQHTKGLICLSACLRGDVQEMLIEDKYDDALRFANEYQDMFGKGNFYLEMQDHGLDQDRIVVPGVSRLSRETGIPLVVTNDAHYLRANDPNAHEAMLCIQTGRTLSDPNHMRFDTPEFYLKTRAEMEKLFGDYPKALDATWDIAQRCHLKLPAIADPFPVFQMPENQTVDSYFEWVARNGFEKRKARLEMLLRAGKLRYPMEVYEERLTREIRIIQQMKFPGYFLIVWDFIRHAKETGIPVGPGRGSAAGSLVAYAMDITDIDPLEYNLLFERFLNPERISMPDIDIDFCTRGRGDVIKYVTEKYGREQVAQIITFGTLGARAAIKDVGRVMDMPYADVEKLTKLIPTQPLNIKLKQAMEMEPNIGEMARANPKVKELLDIAVRLEGMARNASIHAAGVVISPRPLKELVPLYRTNKDEIVTQYDMVGLEKLGLLKMDFLGLTTLTIIADTQKLIQKHRNEALVVEDIPLTDEAAYKIFCDGQTSGIFQFESDGMRDILIRYQPDRLEDLIALNALYRPGPMDMIDDFIDRKHGRKPVTYEIAEMKPILEETYGVMVYQEQVMQMANTLAGYSLGDADLLRRAMGKKKLEEMVAQRQRFLEGALKQGFHPKKIEKVFDHMEKFAGYGFNKSHSAAYAYLAYVTAYLKANYKVEFMSALLTSETGNTAKVVRYINECRERQIQVLPPSVNISDLNFTPSGDAIRFGLGAIKNVGANAVEAIVKVRAEKGKFNSLYEFCENVDMQAVNRRVIESLIRCGAMDELKGTRSQKMAILDAAIETGIRASKDRNSGQSGLFGDMFGGGPDKQVAEELPNVPDWEAPQKLTGEKELLGFYVTGHPLDQYLDKVTDLGTHTTATLVGVERGVEVKVCGILNAIQRKRNQKQEMWAAMQLEDLHGTVDCMVFASKFEGLSKYLEEDKAVIITAKVLVDEAAPPRLSIQDLVALDNARVKLPSMVQLKIKLNGEEAERAKALDDLIQRKPGPAGIRIVLEKSRDFSLTLDLASKVRADREFKGELAKLFGANSFEATGEA
ncbi:DNA polymerase III subunit alpha [Bryobacter aggregatus]|uniref:DNA polymerase III subunit alpha n=1 Tax=Bryobacter aggregatus TaxID=360054 RepID=UPI00056026EF|nr:DNA polymerase III subunit alpha [Bryobacter aggregatus]